MDATGHFTAGSQPGTVAVRATSTVDQSVATAAVTIGNGTTTTTTPSTTTTTLPPPTGTATFNVNLSPGSDPRFVVGGTFNVSITDKGGGQFDASASWGGGSLFVETQTATCGSDPTTYGLGDVTAALFTEANPFVGELTIKVPVTTPPGACPFDSSGFTVFILDGNLLQPNLIQFFRVCIGATFCYNGVSDPSVVSVGGVVQIAGVP